MKSLNGC